MECVSRGWAGKGERDGHACRDEQGANSQQGSRGDKERDFAHGDLPVRISQHPWLNLRAIGWKE